MGIRNRISTFALVGIIVGFTVSAIEKSSTPATTAVPEQVVTLAQTSSEETPIDSATNQGIVNLRAQIATEIKSALTDQEWWDAIIPEKTQQLLKTGLTVTSPLGNTLVDRFQANLNRQLKNLNGDKVGLFGLIPKEIRQNLQGLASAVADPLSDITDKL